MKGFDNKWFWVERPDMEFPHSVFLNDPIQGECVALFKDKINAKLFCKEQELWQFQREYATLSKKPESQEPLSCPKCTKSFPAYMQDVFNLHVELCKNPPPDESQEPTKLIPESGEKVSTSQFVKECYEIIPTTQHIGYLKRTL